jgi:hypothetical protein
VGWFVEDRIKGEENGYFAWTVIMPHTLTHTHTLTHSHTRGVIHIHSLRTSNSSAFVSSHTHTHTHTYILTHTYLEQQCIGELWLQHFIEIPFALVRSLYG